MSSKSSIKSEKPPPPAKPAPNRGNLLGEIQAGIKLKKTEKTEVEERPSSAKTGAGAGGGLLDVIARRIAVSLSSDEDDDDDEDDEDEWSD